jgi:hypothetical protein
MSGSSAVRRAAELIELAAGEYHAPVVRDGKFATSARCLGDGFVLRIADGVLTLDRGAVSDGLTERAHALKSGDTGIAAAARGFVEDVQQRLAGGLE